jgi:hypothetical protein
VWSWQYVKRTRRFEELHGDVELPEKGEGVDGLKEMKLEAE